MSGAETMVCQPSLGRPRRGWTVGKPALTESVSAMAPGRGHAAGRCQEGGAMGGLKQEVDAAEVGLDPGRLERIDRHFARYVDDGRLPGWLITVSRHGRLAHVACCGSRDMEAGLPVEPDTLWRIYSMTKPVTSVATMMLY